jgi:drug/metabolite transporter (DMT)-like permease
MHVLNKCLAIHLKAPALISMVQMAIAVGLVGASSIQPFLAAPRGQLCRWLIVPIFFSAMLSTSFYTYQYISLSLLTVIRNLTPLLVLPIERAIMPVEMRPKISFSIVGSILIMLTGAILYAGGIKKLSLPGVIFALVNMVLAMSDRLIQRRLLTTECKDLASSLCTVMNNLVGLVPTLVLAFATHQIQDASLPSNKASWQDWRIIILLLLSGCVGIGICYLGFECQRAISATSFFVLQNVSKVGVVVAGVLIYHDSIKNSVAVLGLLLSLGGSFCYGAAQMHLNSEAKAEAEAEPKNDEETKPLLTKVVR